MSPPFANSFPFAGLRAARGMALAVVAGWLAVSSGVAAADCPAFPSTVPPSSQERTTLLRQLDAHAEACLQNSAWYSLRGALLLSLGQPAEAAESLERALLLAPDNAAASLDYADALAALGDVVTARELASRLLERPDTPPAARRYLEGRLHAWPEEPSPWQKQLEIGALLGWESNLNGGPAADAVLLTASSGSVLLPLDASQRPREGVASLFDIKGRAQRALGGDWQLMLGGQARLRDTAATRNDYLVSQFDATLLRERPEGDLILQLGRLDQRLDRSPLLSENRFAAVYQWSATPCRPRLGLDAQQRDYPGAAVLNGLQLGLRAGLSCSGADWLIDGGLRLATDRPQQQDRPGGRQLWRELSLSAVRQFQRQSVKAEMSVVQVDDADGYNPLLQFNATRHLRRNALRLELERPLVPHWHATASVEYFAQHSNVDLFELDNLGAYLGLRYRF